MTTRLALAALGATALLTATSAPATAAAPTVDLDPRTLPTAATATPHLEGTTIVAGSTRIAVSGKNPRLLGTSGGGYVVESTKNDVVSAATITRYAADGTSTVIGRGNYFSSRLSQDGAVVVTTHVKQRGRLRTQLTAYAVATGAVVAERRVHGYVAILDADAGRVVLSGFAPAAGTRSWSLGDGSVTLITRRIGHAADLRTDLLATYTKDPYDGGVTVVSRLSQPGKRLWSSASERVQAFSTDGSRMALVGILDDGIGPGAVVLRSTTGAKLATFTASGGYFGDIDFDSPTSLLLDTHSQRKSALVRCVDTTCDRVGPLTRTRY